MKKNIIKIIIAILIIFILSGCYNYKELNKIGIVSSISIDKADNEYLVGAQVMNVKSEEETNSSKIIVYEAKGKSIEEALRKMTTKSNKKLYGGHLGKLVISEEVASESIIDIIDLFQRLPEIKDEFTITISKGIKANKIIKIMTSPESIPADYVKSTIETADLDSALTYSSKLDEFVSYYLKDYIDPVVSVIEVKNYSEKGTTLKNNETSYPQTQINLNNIAVTYNGKLEKYLDEEETIGYNFIRNSINQMIIPVKCDNDDNYASVSIIENKTKNKVQKDNNKYIINFNVNSKSVINEYNCKKDLDKEETIKELEEKAQKIIKNYMIKAINTQNNSKGQFLGLKRMIYLDYPKYNNENYDVNIKVHVNLSRKGDIRNSTKGEKYEYKN
ncbi:MAG: Ger(x)C family spore germination protein [Bacilli bacterium]|nr:Ger(x)C family spore germination protein [Bacilli bacterium]